MHKLKYSWVWAALILVGCVGTTHSSEYKTIRDFAERDVRPITTENYKTLGDTELKILVCKPDGLKAGDKRPAILWIHGGGWVSGAPEIFIPQMKYFASRGVVSFSVQYRLYKGFSYINNKELSAEENAKLKAAKLKKYNTDPADPSIADIVQDCEGAMMYIRKNAKQYGVDPQKITSIGDSSGSHLAASLGTLARDEACSNAVVACSSISDLTTGFGPDYIKRSKGLEDKKMEDDPDRLKRAKAVSPIFNIVNGPSILVLAGGNDWLKDEPENFYKALKAKGVNCEYKVYPKAQHAFIVYSYTASLKEITQAVLDIDAFLVNLGFIDGSSSLKMPGSNTKDEVVTEINEPFTGEKVLQRKNDFPEYLTISMKVKFPQKFNGTLLQMPGTYGFAWNVNNGGHDFIARRMRMRGPQVKFESGKWYDLVVSLGEDKVVIKANDQEVTIENKIKHTFTSNEIIFNKKTGAVIKDVMVVGVAR